MKLQNENFQSPSTSVHPGIQLNTGILLRQLLPESKFLHNLSYISCTLHCRALKKPDLKFTPRNHTTIRQHIYLVQQTLSLPERSSVRLTTSHTHNIETHYHKWQVPNICLDKLLHIPMDNEINLTCKSYLLTPGSFVCSMLFIYHYFASHLIQQRFLRFTYSLLIHTPILLLFHCLFVPCVQTHFKNTSPLSPIDEL